MTLLTLRPNGAGVLTQCTPSNVPNWECVNETPASDEDYVYVAAYVSLKKDYYALPDHTTESGTINSVKVYGRAWRDSGSGENDFYVLIYTGSTEYLGPKNVLDNFATKVVYNNTWTSNPKTLVAWTWDDIDALQAGVGLDSSSSSYSAYCSQVYVEVNYTPRPISDINFQAAFRGMDGGMSRGMR